MLTKQDIGELKLIFLTKEEFEDFRTELQQTLTKHRSDLMNILDKVLKELVTIREEQTISSYKVTNHEDRLIKLEAN